MQNIKKTGRPTDYTPELAEEICDAVATSSKGLRQLCKEHDNWPCADTIFHWRKTHKEFSDLYAQAKKCQIEALIDEILEIADDTSNDTIIKVDEEGNEKMVCNSEWINRSRLKVDTRKWLAAKLCPRLYGDKDERVTLKFPIDLTKGSALLPMSAEVFRALANQEISPEQARILSGAIKDHGANILIGDLNERLAKLENPATNRTSILEGE